MSTIPSFYPCYIHPSAIPQALKVADLSQQHPRSFAGKSMLQGILLPLSWDYDVDGFYLLALCCTEGYFMFPSTLVCNSLLQVPINGYSPA